MGYYLQPIWVSLRDGTGGLLIVAHGNLRGVLRYFVLQKIILLMFSVNCPWLIGHSHLIDHGHLTKDLQLEKI
jgi:hypothetical protein